MEENDKKLEAKIIENEVKKTEENAKDDKVVEEKIERKEEVKRNGTRYKVTKKGENSKLVMLSIVVILLILTIAVLSTIFALINAGNNKILSGISIRNMLVEGMTEEEAVKFINEQVNEEKTREITLRINGEIFSITPEQIETEYLTQLAVEKAYNVGRFGNVFKNNFEIIQTMFDKTEIELTIKYNEELLEKVIGEIEAKLPNAMVDNTYFIDDDELVITRGTDGIIINLEDARNKIIDAIKNGRNEEIEIETEYAKCPNIDIQKIHDEVKSEPQNASYTKEPFQIIPHKVGIDFDVDKAKEILQEEKDEYTIKLTIIEPEIHTNEIGEEAYPDLLSSFSTKYDNTNRPRSKNLEIAMSKLNGVVVMPGEIFSYNKTLGKRTEEAGYQYANGFAGGKVVPMLAGGICQISSTLYDAALYANMNIVERYNHMFQATYVEPGKDATVVYGSLDFKFENTRKYPILIKTKCGGGLAEIKIFGIKEEVEYEIEIVTEVLSYTPYKVQVVYDSNLAPGQEKVSQYGLQGCKSKTYRIRKINGQEVSKEVLSTDTYSPLNKIVRRGATVDTEPTIETNTKPAQEIPETNEITEQPINPTPQEGTTVTENQHDTENKGSVDDITNPETPENTQNQGTQENGQTTAKIKNDINNG